MKNDENSGTQKGKRDARRNRKQPMPPPGVFQDSKTPSKSDVALSVPWHGTSNVMSSQNDTAPWTQSQSKDEGMTGSSKSDMSIKPEIRLSVPWDARMANCSQSLTGSNEATKLFIEERTRLHALYIREEAKTKRLSLLVSAILALGGGVILIFAPDGKQILANWVGASLFVAAGGTAGYKRLWFKSKNTSIQADGKH